MKHVNNESPNLIESYVVCFDINGPWNFTEMALVIGIAFFYKLDYMKPGICNIIKSTAAPNTHSSVYDSS